MAKVEKDYEDLLRSFNEHKVRYCIVGAYAFALYAAPRYTKDMDIFVEAAPENAKKILAALRDFGFSSLPLTERDFSKPGKTVQLGHEPVRVDLLTSIDKCSFPEVWRNRVRGKYGKEKTCFIGLDDFIKNKKASNRMQDQADLEVLKKHRKKRH